MLTIASKFVALFFYPIGFVCVLLTLSLVLHFLKKGRASITALVLGIITLYLSSTGFIVNPIIFHLERQYPMVTTFPKSSAIVLLSGGEVVKAPPRLYDEVNDAGDRILYAGRLARQHVAPRLIITGGSIPYLRTVTSTEAEACARICTELLGVDSSMIVLENRSQTTYENGLYTKELLDSLRLPHTVVLVTSALHMPRSVAIFKKLGFKVYPAPTDYLLDEGQPFRIIGILPSVNTLNRFTNALHEYYGILAYWAMGRL